MSDQIDWEDIHQNLQDLERKLVSQGWVTRYPHLWTHSNHPNLILDGMSGFLTLRTEHDMKYLASIVGEEVLHTILRNY